MTAKNSDEYPQAEANRRRDAVLRDMLGRPPEKHEPLNAKKRKRRTKVGASPSTKAPT
jgi:hypothetical protein